MGELLRKAQDFFLEFLFPKEREVRILEDAAKKNLLAELPPADQKIPFVTSLFNYRNRGVRALVWAIKYKANQVLTEAAGKLLYESILDILGENILFDGDKEVILIPVPSSPSHKREKGFNQAELLAEAIKLNDSENLLKYKPTLIKKYKETPRQTSLKKSERLKNLKNCFQVDTSQLPESALVIIVDDVATTGSTLSEIRRVLIEAGVKKVYGFTLAH